MGHEKWHRLALRVNLRTETLMSAQNSFKLGSSKKAYGQDGQSTEIALKI
jgi:hypothetical protein